MSRFRLVRLILVLSVLALSASCAAGFSGTIKGGMAALKEDPSLEVAVDRIEDIDEGLKLNQRLLFRVPVNANSKWVPALTGLTQETATGIIDEIKASGPYSMPKRPVPPIKVYRIHTTRVLAAMEQEEDTLPSLMDAIQTLSGTRGAAVKTRYVELMVLKDKAFGMDEQIELLKVEKKRKETTDERKAAIKSEVDVLKTDLKAMKEPSKIAEAALLTAIEEMGNEPITIENMPTMVTTFQALGYSATMLLEAGVTSAVVIINAGRALPKLHTELQDMAMRMVKETISEAVGPGIDLSKVSVGIKLKGGFGLTLKGVDIPNFDPKAMVDNLSGKIKGFFQQAIAAPGRAISIGKQLGFQAKLVKSLAVALGKMTGNSFKQLDLFKI